MLPQVNKRVLIVFQNPIDKKHTPKNPYKWIKIDQKDVRKICT